MIKIRRVIILGLLLTGITSWAQKTAGLIVKVGDAEQHFAISNVKELTFSDDGLTVIKTDDVSVEFPEGWQIRFGEVDNSGISFINSDNDSVVQVYNLDGMLIAEMRLCDIRISQLPKGIYIVKFNGNSLKVQR